MFCPRCAAAMTLDGEVLTCSSGQMSLSKTWGSSRDSPRPSVRYPIAFPA